jgi:uncharacterized protein
VINLARSNVTPARMALNAHAIAIGESRIHGLGMIALEPFSPGDVITTLTGPLIRGVFAREAGPNWVGIGPGTWIDPDAHIAHLNHSCAPNAAFGRHRRLIATQRIARGDEVTADYSTTECDPKWQMDCGCSAPHCRKRLYAIQYAFVHAHEPPLASPLMQLIWRKRRDALWASPAFPRILPDQIGAESAVNP